MRTQGSYIAAYLRSASRPMVSTMAFWGVLALTGLLAGLSFVAQAQDPKASRLEDGWHKAIIILTDGDTLEADCNISLSADIVQARQGNRMATFSARQLSYLYFKDENTGNMRYVFSVPYAATPTGYKVPKLYELAYEGKFASLLQREALITDNDMVMNPYTGMVMSRPYMRLVYEYYIRKQDGTFTAVKQRKRDMLLLLQDQEAEIKKFFDERSPEFGNRQYLISLLERYNHLCQLQQQTSSQNSPNHKNP